MSTPQRYEKIQELFAAAIGLEESEQRAVLDRECGGDESLRDEVLAMLERDRDPTSVFDRPVLDADLTLSNFQESAAAPALLNTRLSHYRLKRVIASGGMGTVYEAAQDQPRRTVAVKVMKHGLKSRSALRRFEYESQILARLRHRGIAQVYEAGVHTEGATEMPYFVMEYVPGAKPLTKYADEKKLGSRERLELFINVCEAVYHGHQKGIIHRDLKPANILVDSSGEIKVIDFGVARGTDSDMAFTTLQTSVGQLIGTLQYMSPEQCAGDPHDLDTRSDVYALGVVLYELLCGQLPYDVTRAAIPEALRIVREQLPTKPSTFSRTLRGDLETITLKALEKDRDRRYASALELAQDIQRYLNNEPIVAAPPSAVYRMRKFVRRHRVGVASGIAIAATLVLATGVSISFAASEARQREVAEERTAEAVAARELAEQREKETQKVSDFQAAMLGGIDVPQMGLQLRRDVMHETSLAWKRSLADDAEIERRTQQLDRLLAGTDFKSAAVRSIDRNILANALEAIAQEFGEQPSVQAALLQTVATAYRSMGLYDLAMPPQEQALALRRRHLGNDDPLTATSIHNMGVLLRHRRQFDEARLYLHEALNVRTRLLGAEHPDTITSVNSLGVLYVDSGNLAEAERYVRKVVELQRQVTQSDNETLTGALSNMGAIRLQQGQFLEAETYLREALDLTTNWGKERATITGNLGVALIGQGRVAEAEALQQKASDATRHGLGEEHPLTLKMRFNLALLLLKDQTRMADAERHLLAVIEGLRRVLGDEHPETLRSMVTYAQLLQMLGRYPESEQQFQGVLQISHVTLKDRDPITLTALHSMGVLKRLLHDLDEAERYLRKAVGRRRQVLGDDHPDTLQSINSLGFVLETRGNAEEAERCYGEGVETGRRTLGYTNESVTQYVVNLVRLLMRRGAFFEAEQHLSAAMEARSRLLGHDDLSTLSMLNELAITQLLAGDLEASAESFQRAVNGWHRRGEDKSPHAALPKRNLAFALNCLGRHDEARLIADELLQDAAASNPLLPPPVLAELHRELGWAMLGQGDAADAEAMLQTAIDLMHEIEGFDAWRIARAESTLGECLVALERYDEAEPLLLNSYEVLRATRGEDFIDSRAARRRLVSLYERWERPDEAERYRFDQ